MKKAAVAGLVGLLGICGSAYADLKLVQEKQCMQCHAVDKDTIGPSFKKVKARWKGQADAEKKLIATIRMGSEAGSGLHWGKIKMPDNSERPLVSNAEASKIVKWIMVQ